MRPPFSTDSALPRLTWLGPVVAGPLFDRLGQVALLRDGWDPQSALVLVWAPLGPTALHGLPAEAESTPVLAVCPEEPATNERLTWIEAGAEDLVSIDAAPRAVVTWLRALDWSAEIRPQDPLPPAPPAVPDPAEVVGQGRDPFPPIRVEQSLPAFQALALAWVQSVQRYLAQRHQFVRKYGRGSLPAFLDLCVLRDQVPVAGRPPPRSNVFGQTRDLGEDGLGWPVVVRRATRQGEQVMTATPGRVVSTGSDGLLLDVDFRSLPRQKLVVDLPVGPDANAQLMLEARMQRRLGVHRWHTGAMVLELRLRTFDGRGG